MSLVNLQVQDDYPDTDSLTFSALADPVRRDIVARLAAEGPMTVGKLSEPFQISAPAISRHLSILERAGMIRRSVDRQWRVCMLVANGLEGPRDWLETVLSKAALQDEDA
ncbi:ArsR/SmtB family transcription factor [Pelagibacterium montanilacus]|uniref:ArsR/SmtB family transcription factor n=1 Tax=Pelagibacterium montanilacus TaxID=2185280 RepID=UPI000F8D93F0|nr:metalloregulator ArsR/SmtB family transcription factor [Pelagibacterium montanilacus]